MYNDEKTIPKYVKPNIKSNTAGTILFINDVLNILPLLNVPPGIRLKKPLRYLINKSLDSTERFRTQKAPRPMPRENKIRNTKYKILFSLICFITAYFNLVNKVATPSDFCPHFNKIYAWGSYNILYSL